MIKLVSIKRFELILATVALITMGCTEGQSLEESPSDESTYIVDVMVGDNVTGTVDILAFDATDYETVNSNDENHEALSIAKIIQKAAEVPNDALEDYLAGYICDYESKDGFRASSKGDRCLPVSCSLAVYSYVDIHSHGVFYDDQQPMANVGCYNIRDVNKILMTPTDMED